MVQDYNVLSQLRKIPAVISMFDILMMYDELRKVLIYALQHPEEFQAYFAEKKIQEVATADDNGPSITFNDEDLLVGTADHNRPLFLMSECEGQRVTCMLIDPGSSINLMPKKTLERLTLSTQFHTKDKITIHGFNHKTEQSMGAVSLPFTIGGPHEWIQFYIIDADATYNALIGRPWLYKNNAVPSTLHQCLKYIKDEKIKQINGEIKLFESHEMDMKEAKHFREDPEE